MKTEHIREATVKDTEGTILSLNVLRENDKTVLSIKTNKEIEKLFQNPSTANSEVYNHDGRKLSYYNFPTPEREEELKNFFHPFRINKYGSQLIYNGDKNFSLLRTVGLSQGIKIEVQDLISEELLTEWVQKFKEMVIKTYKNFVRPIEINVIIEKREVV